MPASSGDSKSPERERPQQLLRKAPPSYVRPAVAKAPFTALDYACCKSGCAQPKIKEGISPFAERNRIRWFAQRFKLYQKSQR